jgi:uncharacterized protein
VIIADTSALLALFNQGDRAHASVTQFLDANDEALIVSPFVIAEDLNDCAEVIRKYADQHIGVTDASISVLAKRYQTTSILTLDHRHFSVIRPVDGTHFTLLP